MPKTVWDEPVAQLLAQPLRSALFVGGQRSLDRQRAFLRGKRYKRSGSIYSALGSS